MAEDQVVLNYLSEVSWWKSHYTCHGQDSSENCKNIWMASIHEFRDLSSRRQERQHLLHRMTVGISQSIWVLLLVCPKTINQQLFHFQVPHSQGSFDDHPKDILSQHLDGLKPPFRLIMINPCQICPDPGTSSFKETVEILRKKKLQPEGGNILP